MQSRIKILLSRNGKNGGQWLTQAQGIIHYTPPFKGRHT